MLRGFSEISKEYHSTISHVKFYFYRLLIFVDYVRLKGLLDTCCNSLLERTHDKEFEILFVFANNHFSLVSTSENFCSLYPPSTRYSSYWFLKYSFIWLCVSVIMFIYAFLWGFLVYINLCGLLSPVFVSLLFLFSFI